MNQSLNESMMQLSYILKQFFIGLIASLYVLGCQPTSDEGEGEHSQAKSREPEVLYYFTLSDYVDRELLLEFERRTGVQVIVDTFSSNEELMAKVQSGATGYDVVVPSDFMASIMARQGLLAELDVAKIPNVLFIAENLRSLPFDPEQRFTIPYLWGTVGIGYDSTIIQTPPES